MSDIELAIGLARKIETALSGRGASGTGLREKAEGFARYLPATVLDDVAFIARERNRVAHHEDGELSNRSGYERACQRVLRAIDEIPRGATPEPVFGASPSRLRRPRRRQSPVAGLVVMLVFGGFLLAILASKRSERSRAPRYEPPAPIPTSHASAVPSGTAAKPSKYARGAIPRKPLRSLASATPSATSDLPGATLSGGAEVAATELGKSASTVTSAAKPAAKVDLAKRDLDNF